MENENERSGHRRALDEALRDQVKRLFAVLAMSMVADGGSNVAGDKAEKRFSIGLTLTVDAYERAMEATAKSLNLRTNENGIRC
jgi:hypothetical protein